jgi:antitoxin component YwqK of YwqJK toxin-antitoxin module
MKFKMTKILALSVFLFILMFCACQTKPEILSSHSLNNADGIYKYKEEPFSGRVLDTTHSGRVLLTFNCVNGKIDGEYLEYYGENGNLKQLTTYQKGQKTGPFKELTKEGATIISGNFLDGNRNGEWKSYYVNGKLKSNGLYENGLQSGEWKFFYDNGNIKAEGTYKNGNESKSGRTGVPISGRNGVWKFYSENTGQIELEMGFENGLRSGQVVTYYPNGQIMVKATLKNEEYDGIVEVYDETGQLKSKDFWENGKKVSEN